MAAAALRGALVWYAARRPQPNHNGYRALCVVPWCGTTSAPVILSVPRRPILSVLFVAPCKLCDTTMTAAVDATIGEIVTASA